MSIEPALTADEWAMIRDVAEETGRGSAEAVGGLHGEYAAAAWALHDHPQGFSWGDVDLLGSIGRGQQGDWPDVEALADRIAALLPPRDAS